MAAVTTAIAVNMNILPLSRLVEFTGDNDRIKLLNSMIAAGSISEFDRNNTNSYINDQYAPMQPIYCINYTASSTSSNGKNALAQCFELN